MVAILAEYDALVGLGHACGHNLIAGAAVGAGMALAALKPKIKWTNTGHWYSGRRRRWWQNYISKCRSI